MRTPMETLCNYINDDLDVGDVPMLLGQSGVGKTEMVKKIAKDRGADLYTFRLHMCEPTDVVGFPARTKFAIKDSNGKLLAEPDVIEFVPRKVLALIQYSTRQSLIFLDELPDAARDVLVVIQQGLCDGQLGDYVLDRKRVGFLAAGNPPDIATNGQEMAIPLRTGRLAFYEFPCDHDAALEWAKQFPSYWGQPRVSGIYGKEIPHDVMIQARTTVAAFITKFPHRWHYTLANTATAVADKKGGKKNAADTDDGMCSLESARGWDKVADKLGQHIHRYGTSVANIQIQPRVAASVGMSAALDFVTYLREAGIPDPEHVLANAATFKPSGRIDIDQRTMSGVTAAVKVRPTAPRLKALLTVCRTVADENAFEAGAMVIGQVGWLLAEKELRKLMDAENYDQQAQVKFVRELHALYEPYRKMAAAIHKIT